MSGWQGDLAGSVALVTGAARGQGRAIARSLASRGAVVWATDLCSPSTTAPYPMSGPDDLDETVEEIRAEGGTCVGEVLDVRDSGAVATLVDRIVAESGRLDVLVTCAGIVSIAPVAGMTDEQWSDMLDTNLTGTFHCVRAVLPAMARQGSGRIVAISSMSGRQGTPNLAHYSASKWGVIGLIKSVALEYAEHGVTANVVCPTNVDTPMLHNAALYSLFAPELDNPTREQVESRYAGMSPMRIPWCPPEAIADAVDHLVGDSGRFVTGSVLDIGLGTTARMP
ncbi:mycofactocin-coupled SDR family oxidoreductase [Dietzia kunjamensis]|uniref:mycofactocin-coupled SDR family oxidoreductase n=1 Tax=Dietzia kunjamensis TaxID=322509 RepID=UPI002DBB73AC|nr:mycofactocin-coupled SDR family oxidoreductase [Dietzia kunjamensis]MEB8325949.1 mycofactocin-coupled SDR family oxidoreductase [Dietzia kunjamensis]